MQSNSPSMRRHPSHYLIAILLASFAALYSPVIATPTPVFDLSSSSSSSPSPSYTQPHYPATTHYYTPSASGQNLPYLQTPQSNPNPNSKPGSNLVALTPIANNGVIVEAFKTATKITGLVCTSGDALACVTKGLSAVLGTYFLAYKASKTRKRDLDDLDGGDLFSLDYPPLAGYPIRYRLQDELDDACDWTLIGNATIGNTLHTIHFARNGSVSGIRAISRGNILPSSLNTIVNTFTENITTIASILQKRAEDDEGGIVVDYFWRNSNEQAYKDFQPSQQSTDQYSEDIANDLWNADSAQGCADFLDADGVLGGGLVSIGDHGRPFPDSDGQTDEQIRYCESLRST